MESRCIPILEKRGPLLGSELQQQLIFTYSITAANARKIVERELKNNLILSTKPTHFLHRQFLYYLPGQSLSKKIEEVLPNYKKSVHRVLQSLLHNGGILLKDEAIKVSASVLSKELFKSNETSHDLFASLLSLNIIEASDKKQFPEYVQLSTSFRSKTTNKDKQLFSRIHGQYVNNLFIEWFVNWLKYQNVVSWNSEPNEQTFSLVEFNDQLWDTVCFTYMYGFYRKRDDTKTPSPVVIEAQVQRMLYEEDIEGFITRFKMQDSRYKSSLYGERILPIILYDQLSEKAFNRVKQEGIMAFRLENLLGTGIRQLVSFLKNPWIEEEPEKTAEKWIFWIHKNRLIKLMPRIFDELHFIIEAKRFRGMEYTLRQHVFFDYKDKHYEIEWSLSNEEKNHHIVLIAKNSIDKEKEEAAVSYFSSMRSIKPEIHIVDHLIE